jgi:hypothetical protein
MNQKLVKLPMEFGEALARLARVPKAAVKRGRKSLEEAKRVSNNKPRADGNLPRAPRVKKPLAND